ncbi:ATP-binding protein [Armatimonas sp.]|uniref:ATP-binding protein n=1 Tax=Armatimonas sp. TaxID=1872638 RepID=UPI00375270E9
MLWKIRLLGGLALERDGFPPVTNFRSRKTAGLLAYFALFPGQHSRERLIDLFWPDDPLPQGQQSLRAALTSLRRQVEPPEFRSGSILLATRTHAGLHPSAFVTDVVELEAALKSGNAVQARALAVGPLLPGFYDDWAITAAEAIAARLEKIGIIEPGAVPKYSALPLTHKRLGVPPSLDHFFGRESEKAQIIELLLAGTPVTLMGMGGSGKTRLAAELALAWEGASVFVALADVQDASEVVGRLARLLSVPPEGVTEALAAQTTPLLVLDNTEHLTGATLKSLLLSLRTQLPTLRLLITSRQRLGFPGERLLPLAALPLPHSNAALTSLASLPSVALFVDRAQACRGDFQLTLRNAAALAELVQTLEGVPLAIELAASWTGVLTPTQMTERVRQSRLALPARRGRAGRHQSLWAVAHSSYQLLSPALQRLFRLFSVFRGGATLAAIAAVAEERSVEESVVRLAERSLVRQTIGNELPRFALPEALREFAAERLSEAGEEDEIRYWHSYFFTRRAERLEGQLATEQQAEALAHADAEFDNFATALATTQTSGHAEHALRLSSALWRFWESRGCLREAEAALTNALNHPDANEPANRDSRARALGGLGIVLLRKRDYVGAREKQETALAIRRELGEPDGIAIALYNVGIVASASGDLATAGERLDEAIALLRPINDTHRLSTMLMARGNLEVRRKQPLLGLPYLEEARNVQTAVGNTMGLIYTLMALAALRYELGELETELRLYEEVLPLCVAINDVVNSATAILNMTDTLMEQNADPERIVFLAALGESTRRKHGIPLLPADNERRIKLAPLLAQPHYAALWAQGEATDWQEWDSPETASPLLGLAAKSYFSG